jgi:FKBP-type peptidyl-prolyl cis-trans isomerase
MALSTMVVSERAVVECTAEYGYGSEQYRPKSVPKEASLRFEVTLLRFSTEKNMWDMSDQDKAKHAQE